MMPSIDTDAMALFDAAVRQRVRIMDADEFQTFLMETRPPGETPTPQQPRK